MPLSRRPGSTAAASCAKRGRACRGRGGLPAGAGARWRRRAGRILSGVGRTRRCTESAAARPCAGACSTTTPSSSTRIWCSVLHYRGHEVLVGELRQAVRRAAFRARARSRLRHWRCAARSCRRLAERIDGVDLVGQHAGAMRAARSIYDQLTQQDDVARATWLATERRYDLIAAADVFTYVGDLDAVFAGAVRVLDTGGLFCFAVEAADDAGADLVLRGSLRYAHSRRLPRAPDATARLVGAAPGAPAVPRRPAQDDRRVVWGLGALTQRHRRRRLYTGAHDASGAQARSMVRCRWSPTVATPGRARLPTGSITTAGRCRTCSAAASVAAATAARTSWCRAPVLVLKPGDEYQCTHEHREGGDDCLAVFLAPELVHELQPRRGRWMSGAMPPLAELMVRGELMRAVAAGDSDVGPRRGGAGVRCPLRRHGRRRVRRRANRRAQPTVDAPCNRRCGSMRIPTTS